MRRPPAKSCRSVRANISCRCSGECVMPLTEDRVPNDNRAKQEHVMHAETINHHARLTPKAGRAVSLALARWAIAILVHRPRKNPGA
jgi:hypothetical protein